MILFLALFATGAYAQPLAEDRGVAGLEQSLRKLPKNIRVLHIAAHPDDEDASMLTWLARGEGAHVVLLALNRGEAGANLVSNDFFERLGALRTLEFLKAVDYYGAAGLRFTRFVDYGFSKDVEETFRNWNREEVLRDVVKIVRQEQPHIIISRFQGDSRDGHGNHVAAGLIAQAAFQAAGDPQRFPDAGPAWQPLKLYTGGWRENEPWTIRVDSGAWDPVLGTSFAQLGREGYRQHKSQGMAGPMAARTVSYYRLVGSRVGTVNRETSLLERIDTRIAPELMTLFERRPVTAVVLAEALRINRAQRPGRDRDIKEAQILTAIEQSSGVRLETQAEPLSAFVTAGQQFTVQTRFQAGSPLVVLDRIELAAPQGWTVRPAENGRFVVSVASDAASTVAYWTRASVRETRYTLSSEDQLGMPLPAAPLRATAHYRIAGVDAKVSSDVRIAVAPQVSLRFSADAGYLPLGTLSYSLRVAVKNHMQTPAEGTLRMELPSGWSSDPSQKPFRLEKANEELVADFVLKPPPDLKETAVPVRAIAEIKNRKLSSTFTTVTQPGLDSLHMEVPARHVIQAVNVRTAPGLRTGYITGTGDDIPEAMRQLGMTPHIIDTAMLATGDLSQFNTIVTGIRAWAARSDVKTYNARLLEYVKNGGVFVVQYNTQEFDSQYGPFPYQMTARAEEVSEEDAPVRILAPESAVFRWPNSIGKEDFDFWVEQRGSKFFTTWDKNWQPLIELNDRGQAPQRGAWLAAPYGKGLYVYCALAWYRQLPFAVPGAARLFANLISLGSPESPWRQR